MKYIDQALYHRSDAPFSAGDRQPPSHLRQRVDGGEYELVVIDVLERPQFAEDEKILATPMVVKELPPPIRRIIGDLSDTERMLLGLDLRPFPS